MTNTLNALIDTDLQDLITSVVTAHSGEDGPALWQRLSDLGLADLTGHERRGGSEATWREAAVLVRALSAHGCTLDIGQSDLVAGWLLDRAAIAAPPALRTVHGLNEIQEGADQSLTADGSRAVVISWHDDGWALAEAEHHAAPVEDHAALHWAPIDGDAVEQARLRLALVRAVQITGALDSITALAIEHAQTREQFGRPIGARQAVQQMVSHIAAETALARAATDAAVLIAAESTVSTAQLAPAVAVARSCTGHAVDPVVRMAHQVIGAIGTTEEHRLHTFTSAALSLRNQQGTSRDWDRAVLTDAAGGVTLSDLSFTPDN